MILALGSNLGDRRQALSEAVRALQASMPTQKIRLSHIYETPALLPPGADPYWNRPYLNIVCELATEGEPLWLLDQIKIIEKQIGREPSPRWAPRKIDIDILLWDELNFQHDRLKIPHPELHNRAFVLDPLKDIRPEFLSEARRHSAHAPIWMGILNVTPDSFSDGGAFESLSGIEKYCDEMSRTVGYIDVGAESTRPGATLLTPDEEWMRLEPVLKFLNRNRSELGPRISLDTRHAQVASRALSQGVDVINDVSGLSDPQMIDVLRKSTCDYVLNHSMSIPADPNHCLPQDASATDILEYWFRDKLHILENAGISKRRVILDPGIGFGKNSLQSLELMSQLRRFTNFNCRLMVGHSRKSFMNSFSKLPPGERDFESIGISLQLVQFGADILRVHNPMAHARSFMAFNHLRAAALHFQK